MPDKLKLIHNFLALATAFFDAARDLTQIKARRGVGAYALYAERKGAAWSSCL